MGAWINRAITAGDAVRRARAIAEFEEWEFVVHFHGKRTAEMDRTDEILLSKELARRAVTLDIAQALHVSEQHVWALVHEASTITDRTPLVWGSFREGDIDAVRVSAIAATAEKLQTSEALSVLERSAPEYAASHTIAELRAWLRRLRARLEPEQVSAEASRATDDRRVSITHNDDGTSWLNALRPTGVAVVIGDRLRRTARAVPAVDPVTGEKDRRTRDQKQADQLGEWLTSCLDPTPDMGIPVIDFIGLIDGPGFTLDGEPVGADWVRELAQSEHTVLRRLVLDPIGEVLDTTVLSYRPP